MWRNMEESDEEGVAYSKKVEAMEKYKWRNDVRLWEDRKLSFFEDGSREVTGTRKELITWKGEKKVLRNIKEAEEFLQNQKTK
ncbi:unnamed protein product [Lampetra planeri]